MKKPGKKTIIPALFLAGGLMYRTLADKVKDTYNQTMPQTAVEDVVKADYKALDRKTNDLASNKAYAGGMKKEININETYERLDSLNNPSYPDNIKRDPFGPEGLPDHMKSVASEGRTPGFYDGKFTDLFFSEKYHDAILNIFVNDGYDKEKINKFFRGHRNENSAIFFPEDGYLFLKHKTGNYILPLSTESINSLVE